MLYWTPNLRTNAIPANDRAILRALAGRVQELAHSPENIEKRQANFRTNDLQSIRPLIMAHPQGAWAEILPTNALRCEHPLMQIWENDFRQSIYQHEIIRDDTVLTPYLHIPWIINRGDFGVPNTQTAAGSPGGSYAWHDYPIRDLDRDLEKLKHRQPSVDRPNTLRIADCAREMFGDLLAVRVGSPHAMSVGLTCDVLPLIGMENMMLAMCDQPEGLHRLMAWMRDECRQYLSWLERERLLNDNCDSPMTGTDGSGYTACLPARDRRAGDPVQLKDLWGLAESQETVGISPEMFGEFIFPYQLPLTANYGLNYYGCCEPVEKRLDSILQIPRLRSISVSPWASQEMVAERLGRNYAYCRKPHPTLVCSPVFDEAAIRADVRCTLEIAGSLNLVFVLKDTHTVHGDVRRIPRWVEIAREETAHFFR